MRLYDHPLSGNGYKVRLLLSHLGTSYDYVPVDLLAGEGRTESFLRKNPLGKVPVLELDDGRCLAESDAILFWLGRDTAYWPQDAFDQALAMKWLFFEQRNHQPTVAGARFLLKFASTGPKPIDPHELERLQHGGRAALEIMEQHLAREAFLAGPGYSIADIGLYAYTHLAHEAGIDLAPFAAIREWLKRIESQPGYVRMNQAPSG